MRKKEEESLVVSPLGMRCVHRTFFWFTIKLIIISFDLGRFCDGGHAAAGTEVDGRNESS